MIDTTIPVTILDRKWENGITPPWAVIFSRREVGWLTVRPGRCVLQSFTRDKKGNIIGANILEVIQPKTELTKPQILKICGETRGKIGATAVDYTSAGNMAVTLSVKPQDWNLLHRCFNGMGRECCLC